MTDTNKQALEALDWAVEHTRIFWSICPKLSECYETIRAALVSSETAINLTQADLCKVCLKQNALEPKPSVDVEDLDNKFPIGSVWKTKKSDYNAVVVHHCKNTDDIMVWHYGQGTIHHDAKTGESNFPNFNLIEPVQTIRAALEPKPSEVVEALRDMKKNAIALGNFAWIKDHPHAMKKADDMIKKINAALSLLTAQEGE